MDFSYYTSISYLSVVLGAYAVIILLAVISHFMPKKVVKGIMIVVYVAMLAAEGVKQYVAFTAEGGYDLWMAPLHFSSTFYITVGLTLLGGKRLKHVGQTVLFVGGIMLFVMITASPYSIFGEDPADVFTSADSIHGYFYHMAVLLQLAVMLAGGEYRPRLYDPIIFAVFVALYGCVAVPIALTTQLNFAGIVQAYVPVLETFRLNYGQAAYLAVFYLTICIAGLVLIYIYILLRKPFEKKRKRKDFNKFFFT